MDLIEALEKTKIKYPYLKTVEGFLSILNYASNSSDPLFKEAKDKVKAYLNVLVASKDLYEALNDKKSTLLEINEIIKTKSRLANTYKKLIGKVWPL